MINISDIEKALGIEVYTDTEMLARTERWINMYKDNPYWKDKDTRTLNLPATIASEIARLTTIELKSEITTETESELIEQLNETYQEALSHIKIQVEYAAAMGGVMFKPYLDDDKVAIDFVQPDMFIPVEFDGNGNITSGIFLDQIIQGQEVYTKLEYHRVDDILDKNDEIVQAYVVENLSFVSRDRYRLGDPIPLEYVAAWSDLEHIVIFEDIPHNLYTYFKMPIANQVNTRSPLGVSIYSRVEEIIKDTDMLYTSMLKEYELSEKKVFISEDMLLRDANGNFVDIPSIISVLDADEPGFYKEFAPEIRTENYFDALNNMYRIIERGCSLAYGTLSEVTDVAKTATEIKSSKQKSYATVLDIQKNLEKSLMELIDIIAYWLSLLHEVEIPEFEVSFDFDDSLVVDNETEQKTLLLEVSSDIRTPESYLKEMYDMTDEQIKDVLPGLNDKLELEKYDNLE